jgi:uncharacterized protein YihD (DUF1040 family)
MITEKIWTEKGYNKKNLDLVRDKVIIDLKEDSFIDNFDEIAKASGFQKDLTKISRSNFNEHTIGNLGNANSSKNVGGQVYDFIRKTYVKK